VLLLAGGPLVHAQATPDRVLTLDDSVRLALNNSQALLSAREDENIALQRVRQAESLFFPKLDLNANWSKFSVDNSRPLLLQPQMGSTLITDNPRQNFYTARANIYQTIYEGGRSRNTWRQARISYERAKSADEALQMQVTSVAKQAFYDLLFAQVKERHYADAVKAVEKAGLRNAGVSLREEIRLEGALSELRAAASQARLDSHEAKLAYLHALNLELNTEIELKGELRTEAEDIDLQKMLAWASQYRSELRQTEYQQELDALSISLSLAERTPTLGFGASYERAGNEVGLPQTNWAGTLNVNLPISISDLVYGWAKVRERRAQYRQATLRHADTSDQIQKQVRDAYTRYRFWQDELVPRSQALDRVRRLVDRSKRAGPGIADRVEAEKVLVDAEVRYEEAVHGHLSALAALERAVSHNLHEDR
jgi:outer membrane protein